MLGSPDHVALRLRRWRLSVRATVRANVVASVLLGGAGLALTMVPPAWALGILGALLATAIGLAALAEVDRHVTMIGMRTGTGTELR